MEEEHSAIDAELSASDNVHLETPPKRLPPLLLTLLHTIIATLQTSFPTAPPHTSQRLAELLLAPRKHYHTLPSYLRALDRIVSVASPASVFPLKAINTSTPSTNGALSNGICSPSPDPADDVDFIGGAELTEIPWAPKPQPVDAGAEGTHTTTNGAPTNANDLRTESTSLVEGPNGLGGVETVTVANGISSSTAAPRENVPAAPTNPATATITTGASTPAHGISQGELLRQEQEAGIVPVPSPVHSSQSGGGSISSSSNSSRVTRSSAAASAAASRVGGAEGSEEAYGAEAAAAAGGAPEEEIVHVRGPGVIGMEDMGPQAPGSGLQGGIDVEGALGRRGEIFTPNDAMMDANANSHGTGATQQLDGLELEEGDGEEVVTRTLGQDDDGGGGAVRVGEEQDTMITDADGIPDDDVDDGEEEVEGKTVLEPEPVTQHMGPDAVDTTAL